MALGQELAPEQPDQPSLDPEARFQAALELQTEGRYLDAAKAYRELFHATDSEDPADDALRQKTVFHMAQSLMFAARYEDALRNFAELISRWPGTRRARTAHEYIMRLEPHRATKFRALIVRDEALRLRATGDHAGAFVRLKEALEDGVPDVIYHELENNAAQCAMSLRLWEEAAVRFERAAEGLEPDVREETHALAEVARRYVLRRRLCTLGLAVLVALVPVPFLVARPGTFRPGGGLSKALPFVVIGWLATLLVLAVVGPLLGTQHDQEYPMEQSDTLGLLVAILPALVLTTLLGHAVGRRGVRAPLGILATLAYALATVGGCVLVWLYVANFFPALGIAGDAHAH